MASTPVGTFERVALRPTALAILALVPGIPAVVLFWAFGSNLTPDYVAVTTAVPLIMLYLIARLTEAFVKMPTDEQRREANQRMRAHPAFIMKLAMLEAVLIVTAVVLCVSAPMYSYLGLERTWVMAFKIGGAFLGVAGFTSIATGFLLIAIESHKAGGFVHQCHQLCLIIVDVGRDVLFDIRNMFDVAAFVPARLR